MHRGVLLEVAPSANRNRRIASFRIVRSHERTVYFPSIESVGVNGMTVKIALYKSLELLAMSLGATSITWVGALSPAWGEETASPPATAGETRSVYPTNSDRPLPGIQFDRPFESNSAEDLNARDLEVGISQLTQRSEPDEREILPPIVEELDEDPDFAILPLPRYSSIKGFHATLDFIFTNLGPNDQTLDLRLEGGERTLGAILRYTDPWQEDDPFDSGYQVRVFNTRSPEDQFLNGDREVELIHEQEPWVDRLGGGIEFFQPVTETGVILSAGANYQRVAIRNAALTDDVFSEDRFGNSLTFSNTGIDTLVTLSLGAFQDRRNDEWWPTSGYRFRVGTEQSIPVGNGEILFNRLTAGFTQFVTVSSQTFVFNIQGGTILGDVPPYQAFDLGGGDSVRGYADGEIGTGQSYVQGTVEYRFPIVEDLGLPMSSRLGGTVFADFASDLGSGDEVHGEPGEVRDKPGSGFGVGVGLRLLTDFGPLRVEVAVNDESDFSALFKIGERF